MQSHDAYPDLPANSTGTHANGATATPVDTTEPYVHPTIPLGLPHVVQFVEASIHHLPMSVRFVGDRMSRYANATGVVSMAIPFICQITGLGSKNTAEHHIRLMESMGILEKKPGKGGKDRKSNTYIFLGEQRNWKPLPTERPGTDPWIALAQARRENEELRAEIAWLKNGGAIGHSGVTDGEEAKATQPTSHSYETADYSASTDPHGAIGHSGVTDGEEAEAPSPTYHSYETADYSASTDPHGAIGHSGVTDGEEAEAPSPTYHSYETANYSASTDPHGAIGHSGVTDGEEAEAPSPTYHSYETADYSASTDPHGAIGHSGVTDGSGQTPPHESSHSQEAPDSEPSSATREATGHSAVTNGSDEGQEYLARRARVEALVMEQQSYYDRSFRGGVLSAIHHFSLNSENEGELLRQVTVLRAGQKPGSSRAGAARGADRPPPREEPLTESGRREVEYCPDCTSPYTTFNGEERCPDCTDLRRRESEA